MSEPLIVGQLRVCADCALDSPNGNTYLNAAARPMMKNAALEIERLRRALYEITGLDHHNHGPESRATKIARDALNGATAQV